MAAVAPVPLASHAVLARGWQRAEPCGVVLPPPEARTRDGCPGARCVATPDAREVCTCAAPPDATGGPLRMSVREGDREVRTWAAEPMLGDGDAFRVALADLDGDGRDELVVATPTSVSNGMAVQSWSLCLVARGAPASEPTCVQADDFPFLTTAVRVRGERACRLLAARWLWGSEPRRGAGLYLVGRPLTARDGALARDPARPAIARRYLYRFAAERADAVENARTAPISWWRDPTTRTVRCPDPLCDAEARADRAAEEETKEER